MDWGKILGGVGALLGAGAGIAAYAFDGEAVAEGGGQAGKATKGAELPPPPVAAPKPKPPPLSANDWAQTLSHLSSAGTQFGQSAGTVANGTTPAEKQANAQYQARFNAVAAKAADAEVAQRNADRDRAVG